MSLETLGLGEAVSDRKTLLRHSRALIWTALKADVVGGCTEGAASGGKERAVGWTSAISGATNVVRNDGVELVGVVGSSSMLMSASMTFSSSNSSSKKRYVNLSVTIDKK